MTVPRFLGFAALAIVFEASLGSAAAVDVAVIRDRSQPAYADAEEAIVGHLESTQTKFVTFAEGSSSEAAAEARVWIAIGPGATQWATEARPSSTALVACLAVSKIAPQESAEAPAAVLAPSAAQQLRLIREVLPEARVVATLQNTASAEAPAVIEEFRRRLPADWRLEVIPLSPTGASSSAVSALLEKNPDLIWTYPDVATYNAPTVKALLLGAMRKKKPVYGFSENLVDSGALFGLQVDVEAHGREAARIALQVLDGSRPFPNAPVYAGRYAETTAGLALNLGIAEVLGAAIPPELIARANHLVEASEPVE